MRSATLARQMRDGADHGIAAAEVRIDFAQVMQRVSKVVREIEPHASIERCTALGVDVVEGTATIIDPWHVRIVRANQVDGAGEQLLSTRAIVIATGAQPFVPPLPGLEDVCCVTSDTLWGLRELPARRNSRSTGKSMLLRRCTWPGHGLVLVREAQRPGQCVAAERSPRSRAHMTSRRPRLRRSWTRPAATA